MFNQNNMFMPMMQFPVHNQNEIKREEIIRPYKEIIKQLEQENKELKDENNQLKMQLNQYQMNNMGNMGKMNNMMMNPMNNNGNMSMMGSQNNMMNQMNPINNMGNMGMIDNQFNMMNPMNSNIMNSPMYQMCNQMNFVGNQMIPMMQMGNKSPYIKFLSIRVKMEDGVSIIVQNTSNDKMEKVISKFCCKTVLDKKDYDFFVITEHKAKFDSTVEENGINGNDDYILVKKKNIKNEKDNLAPKMILAFSPNEINGNNVQNKKVIEPEPIIKGNLINLKFNTASGLKCIIHVGLKNTFRDAAILFCNKVNIDSRRIYDGDLVFLLNSEKLDVNDYKTLEQIKIVNDYTIYVYDNRANIIGA